MNHFIPRRTAVLTALLVALVAAVVTSMLVFAFGSVHYLLVGSAVLFFSFITSFLGISYTHNKFFYDKVRQIYKNILQLRSSSTSSIPRKIKGGLIISEIDKVLKTWEKENKEVIDHLKELEVYRREFLGNVSHELKTPIFTVQGYVHTLMDGGIEDQEVNMLYLGKAAKSIERLITIVDDLESISRIEAGELILENRTFEINELISDVMESLEVRAKEKNITFRLHETSGRQCYVYADKERIRQVLVNLIENSVKYGKSLGTTYVKVDDQGDFITVEVSDNGIGIEKQHLHRLFERFYRVDKSRSREQGGTGLGLAIVKHIIEKHGEKIGVESTIGEGTTFTFTLKKSI